jgi:hypothetical protein
MEGKMETREFSARKAQKLKSSKAQKLKSSKAQKPKSSKAQKLKTQDLTTSTISTGKDNDDKQKQIER